jgi:hypothetical protein
MTIPTNAQDALLAVAVMAGSLRYCPRHNVHYRGLEGPDATLPYYDRYLAELREFFPTPVHFYTAMKHARAQRPNTYCQACSQAVGFN